MVKELKEDHLRCKKRIFEQKSSYAGHVLRDLSGDNAGRQNLRKESDRAIKKNVDGRDL